MRDEVGKIRERRGMWKENNPLSTAPHFQPTTAKAATSFADTECAWRRGLAQGAATQQVSESQNMNVNSGWGTWVVQTRNANHGS